LYKLQKEFLGVTELRLIAIEAFKHLELVHFWQYFQETAQFLRADIVMTTVLD
jgi:hypothetical protein